MTNREPLSRSDESADSPRLVGVRAAARTLGVHENTLRNWEARGLLKATRLPSGIRRFSADDVARMREEMMTQFAPATELPERRRARGEVVNEEEI